MCTASYAVPLIKTPDKFIQITPEMNANIGTSFTNISQSCHVQLGKFNIRSESGYWNSRLNEKDKNINNRREIFIFVKPQLMYQFYNSTVEGGMFIKDKGPITSFVKPLVVSNEVGVMYAGVRYNASFSATYVSKEAESQYDNHSYGKIKVAYRFN